MMQNLSISSKILFKSIQKRLKPFKTQNKKWTGFRGAVELLLAVVVTILSTGPCEFLNNKDFDESYKTKFWTTSASKRQNFASKHKFQKTKMYLELSSESSVLWTLSLGIVSVLYGIEWISFLIDGESREKR